MRNELGDDPLEGQPGPGWCCTYCGAPLRVDPHGLFCAREGRFFARHGQVERLLPHERRRELLPFVEFRQRLRRDQGEKVEPGLPDAPATHPLAGLWLRRARALREGLGLVERLLPPGPWRVLEVGAGCCWASGRLVRLGHQVVATDVDLDPELGLPAADRLLVDPSALPRAEAETESLPFEAGSFDLVLAAGSLHRSGSVMRALVELRRVTRRGGALLAFESPVYRRREEGEAAVAARMRAEARRYGVAIPRESQPGYLVHGELPSVFAGAGWRVDVHGWPGLLGELLSDLSCRLRFRPRPPRFPVLTARREG